MKLPAYRNQRAILTALAAILLPLYGGAWSPTAHAEGITGFLEYGFSDSTSEVSDSTRDSEKTTSSAFRQRYYLNLDRSIYPNLRFNGGGLFEKTMTTSETDDIETDIETTRFTPRADLTLSNIFYNAGIGYSRRTDTAKLNGESSPDNIIETMTGRFSLKPEGLPTLNIFYTRTNFFDENRETRDTTTDAYSLATSYSPLKDLDLGYLGQYTKQTDKLNDRETTSTLHNGRIAYSRLFLEGRASISGTYNISQQTTENLRLIANALPIAAAFTKGPSASLPGPTDTVSFDFAAPSPVLTNGSSADGSAGFLIGSTSLLSTEELKTSHFGLDLQVAGPTNSIFVSIGVVGDLPPATADNDPVRDLAAQFNEWLVYKSNDNRNWTQINPIKITFTTTADAIGVLENSFELSFPSTTARYFKVVVRPRENLTPPTGSVGPVEVYVTETRSFLRIAESTQSTSNETVSHLLNLGGRIRIYDPGDVNYEFFYNYSKSDTDFFSSTRYTISNALRAQHRFNRILTGSARVGREDSSEVDDTRTAYLYSASLQATPLPLLTHTLVYSGRNESADNGNSSSHSLYLNNFASPYRGVDLSLSAGYSTNSSDTGQTTDSLTLSIGTSLVPNPKLSINMNYAASNIKQSGGNAVNPDTTTHRGDLSVSYNPVRSVFLHGSVGIFAETDKNTTTTQSFGGSWGILRDGSLQLNFSYNENYNQVNNQKERTIVPSLRWNIRPGSHLDVSYLISSNSTDTEDDDFTSLSALLRIGF